MGGQGGTKAVPYEFPTKPSDRDTWERLVTDAINSKALGWSHVVDTQWLLAGTCPRCEHLPVSHYYDFGTIVAGDLHNASFDATKGTRSVGAGDEKTDIGVLPIEFVCSCETEHKKDVKGCGWGKGLIIRVPGPS